MQKPCKNIEITMYKNNNYKLNISILFGPYENIFQTLLCCQCP